MKSQNCMYYLQGRCRFGEKCFYNHDFSNQGYIQALMIRHSISTFNQFAEKFEGRQFEGQMAQSQFQFNRQYIDCKLSEKGKIIASQVLLPDNYFSKKKELDIMFVSPLNRTLETADLIIKNNQLKVKKIIILPEISEVLSKICDFSGPLQQKIKKYPNFNFDEMQRFISEQKQNEDSWQDAFVDRQYKKDIKIKQKNGDRYYGILKYIFPTPLQNSQRCFERSTKALEIMKEIAQRQKAKKIIIVSHNRILKYFDGRYNKGRAHSFQNCEIRKLIF